MDDLQRELGRLETTLAQTTPDSRVIGELAAMRGEIDRTCDGSFKLANLRIASPCKQRWADMTGDERVRVCNGCDRPVFNLSEMTRDQAEAVLAARGIKPCVRFYRRADGTVMTADCPSTARRSRRLTVIAAGTLLGAASPAMAAPEPAPPTEETTAETTDETTAETIEETPGRSDVRPREDDIEMGDIDETEMGAEPVKRRGLEWSTWARAGYGAASRPSTLAARTTTPLMPESLTIGEGALGADVSYALAHRGAVRIGAWAEWRTVSDPVLGGELIVGGLPSRPYGGNKGVVLRGGGNRQVVTGALGVGYTAADPWLGHNHATGLRTVMSVTRSIEVPQDWSVTIGLELDPIGALGYIFHRVR